MGIGTRIRELRKQQNLTLKQVGDYLGVTPTAISCYESETRKPSPQFIEKLAELFETTADDIIGIKNDSSNFRKILNSRQLHWDGTPLREDELNFIKQFLEIRIKDKEELERQRCLTKESNIC